MGNAALGGNGKPRVRGLGLLADQLPSGWRLDDSREDPGSGPDVLATITAPDGVRSTLAIEVQTGAVEPSDLVRLVPRLRQRPGAPVVLARFISPETRRRLRDAGVAYVDATGNVEVLLARPALYISKQGALKDPAPARRPTRSLKGPAAGRIVRALCDLRGPIGVRALAARARATPGYVSKLVAVLARDDLVTRDRAGRGAVAGVAWRRLIARWADDYSFVGSNRAATYLEPRSLGMLRERLERATFRRALTASFVATELAPVVSPGSLACFVDDPESAARELGLRPADSGGNVILAAPFDEVVYERPWRAGPLPMAALPQVAVDLATGPGRGPSEADALLDWMERNEDAWRA